MQMFHVERFQPPYERIASKGNVAHTQGMRLLLCLLMASGNVYSREENAKSIAVEEISKAEGDLLENYHALVEEFRIKIGTAVSKADRVEIFLLGEDGKSSETDASEDPFGGLDQDKWFKIAPYHHSVKILQRADPDPRRVPRLVGMISEMLKNPGQTLAGCHQPVHGLRVFSGQQLLFETSLCYGCRNYYLNTPVSSLWIPLPENGIRAFLTELMPAPDRKSEDAALEFLIVMDEPSAETENFKLKAQGSRKEEFLVAMKGMKFQRGDIVSATVTKSPTISLGLPGEVAEDSKFLSISIELSEVAGERVKSWTAQHLGKRIALALDKQVITAPNIGSEFGKSFLITGAFSREEAEQIAEQLSRLVAE